MSATAERDGIAIVGMACMFPGAPDLDAYWHNILAKVDATSDPPPEAWDPEVYYDPEFEDLDRTYCKRGGYLGSLATFEPLAHGVPPVAVGGEPDQWLALQIARDALADAGASELAPEVRARTAIILGKGTYLNGGNAIAVQRGLVVGQTIELIRRLHPEYSEAELEALRGELQSQLPRLGPETVPGLIPNIIVGRIANRLDLMGPAYTVDAACASSLVALQHALRELRSGDCDLALAGGAQVWMPVATLNLFCRLGALSRRGQLRAFDKDADGTLLGEGIGIVVLKRAAEAVRDGDRVYAVIRGVGVSSDGRGLGVMAPRVEGEELALRRAYRDAGVSPRTVGLVEAHGTGTPLGDATEAQALTRVFGERQAALPHCALGTVKSMISHTIPAAGVAGLIKTALALHHRVLPPTLHCEEPSPELGLERAPFYINTETRPWIHGGSEPRRAGINAFGFGGINAHAVLEEFDGAAAADHRPAWQSEVVILEAASPATLGDTAQELLTAVGAADGRFSLADLAFTLIGELGAVASPRRLAIVASSLADLRGKLAQAIEKLREPDCKRIRTTSGIYYQAAPLGRAAKVVLVFPGEGAQYPNMLAELCLQFPPARAVFDRIDRLYADHPRGHVLSDWVYPRPAFSDEERAGAEARLMELDMAVESVLTANAAAHAVLARLVPRVDAMLGHSTGEHSAAMAAGALDLETDERLGRFCLGLNAAYADAARRHDVPGAVLLALATDADSARAIARRAGGELYLAMDNCPHQSVLVGDAEAGAEARRIAAQEGVICEELPYDRAVHTPLFAPFAEDLRRVFAGLPVRTPAASLWSCTTAAPCPDDPALIRELLIEHWTSPVRFRETIEALYEDGARVFIESGPRGNMTTFVEDILRGKPHCAVAPDLRRRSGVVQLCHMIAQLAVHDVELDPGRLFEFRRAQTVDWRALATTRETPAPPKAVKISLSTAWPMLKLSEEVAARLRPRSPEPAHNGAVRAPDAAPDAAPVAAAVVGRPWDERDALASLSSHAPVLAGPEAIAAAAPVPAPADPYAAKAIEAHLETMTRFLQTSEEVMQAYLATAAPAPVSAPPPLPLVGTIVAHEPGRELLARRIVDPTEDRYLLHHTLGRDVSQADPELTGLALMPLAMSIEILAEAAAALLPGLNVIGLRDVRAHRWLAFAQAPLTLECSAKRLPAEQSGEERVSVELREVDHPAGLVIECVVLLARDYPPAPPALPAPLDGGRPARTPPEEMYERVMFHQPLWQAVETLELVAAGGVKARLRVLPRAGLLRGAPDPRFVLDPVILDAAGQAIGFWAAEVLERARVVFPFRLAALELFGGPCPGVAGEALSCTAAIELDGEQLVRSRIDVHAADGSPWMRLHGWEDRRFDVPDRLRPLAVPSRLEPLSAPWPAAPAPPGSLCRRLDSAIPADGGLWKQVWAGRVLSRRERELFAALRAPEPRQLEWLGARTAAKEALAELLNGVGGGAPLPADIEIVPDDRGAPRVTLLNGRPEGAWRPIVSLAHAGGEAAALAALVPSTATAGIGIDLERLQARPAGFGEAALTAAERELLLAAGVAGDEWILRGWCAKEAAGKALGQGLALTCAPPRLASVDPPSETVTVDVDGRRLPVQTRLDGGVVVATVLWIDGKDDALSELNPEVLEGIVGLLSEMKEDWEYDGAITPDTYFIADLGLESLEIVVLATMIQQQYGRLPFPEFFDAIGQRPVEQRDVSVSELVEFVCKHRQAVAEEV